MGLTKNQSGFSLIELMVVIAIVGTLIAISIPLFKSYRARAKETEGGLNVRHMSSLIVGYKSNNELTTIGTMSISVNNFLTETSCNKVNPFGFALLNCRKINFVYGSINSPNGSNMAFAVEGGRRSDNSKRINPSCAGISLWISTGSDVYQTMSPPRRPDDCLTYLNVLFGSKIGSEDLAFDFNGDKVINTTDSTFYANLVVYEGFDIFHYSP